MCEADLRNRRGTRAKTPASKAAAGALTRLEPNGSALFHWASALVRRQLAGNDVLDLRDRRPFRVDVVSDDLAAPHHDDSVDHLEHVVDVVGDEYAGMTGVAGIAHE